jgi:hypothetical protein
MAKAIAICKSENSVTLIVFLGNGVCVNVYADDWRIKTYGRQEC